MSYANDFIVVEFSVKQQAFHKENLDDMIVNNLTNIFRGNTQNDYLAVGIFVTNEDADDFINAVFDKFKKTDITLQQDAAVEFIKNILSK